jgi:hypothetical protein
MVIIYKTKKMKLYQALCVVVFLLGGTLPLFSQQITLKGKIVDAETGNLLDYANVVLLQAADSTFVKGMVTDENGSFVMEAPQTGQYLLRIGYLGYQQTTLNVHQHDMGVIGLSPDTQLLGEVVITAVPKIHKMENGGISTDIQNSRLKNLGTANDVLAQLPFVTRDGESFTVFGKGAPLIYVNNRLIRDLSELQELNSANIKKITVITNPGAEYDATVKSVIKIETLKPQGEGLSGSATGNMYIDKKFSHSELINLNYRKDNLDLFGMFRFSRMKDLILDDMEQVTNFTEPISIRQTVAEHHNTRSIRSNLGFNYLFGKDNSVGMKYEQTNAPAINALLPSKTEVYRNNQLTESFSSDWDDKAKKNSHYVNAYLNLNPFSWLSVKWDMDYASGDNTRRQDVLNRYANTTENIRTDSRQDYDLWASKLTMTTSIGKGKLTYGGEYSNTYNRQDFDVNKDEAPQNLSPNNNTAKQNLFAGFISFNQTFGRFSADLGLRYENTVFDYYVSGVKMDEQSSSYQNCFPNASVGYSGENLSTSLSYRNTIYRPSYYDLRNSVQYDNPYTYETGNPYLKPIIINTLSYLFMWKDIKLMTDLDLRKDDLMTILEQYSDETVLLRPVNLDKSQSFSASVSYSPTFGIWKPVVETGIWKYFLEYSGVSYNTPRYFFTMRNSAMLFKSWQAGVDISYYTAGNSQLFYIYEVFNMDVSLSKSFFDGKLRLNLRGTDLFNTAKQKTDVMVDGIVSKLYKDRNTRGIQLSLTYRFNVTPSKYKGEAVSDELNRL